MIRVIVCLVMLLCGAEAPASSDVPVPVDPRHYGAKCDGSTDDSEAFQKAFDAVGQGGNFLYLPASRDGCKWSSTVIYSAKAPLLFRGEGPGSKIIVAAGAGGLKIIGTCGAGYESVYLENVSFIADVEAGYAVQLWGVAAWGLDNVNIISRLGVFKKGIHLLGSQQGRVFGGLSKGNIAGISLDDCNTVSSNGVDIGGGRTFVDSHVAVEVRGGASDVWIHNVHITSSLIGISIDQTTGYGGYGQVYITQVHIENNADAGVELVNGRLIADGVNDYNTAIGVRVLDGGYASISRSLINGRVVVDSGARVDLISNIMNRAFINHGKAGNARFFGNVGNGAPSEFFTVASLPGCTIGNYIHGFVTDALNPVSLSPVIGGGGSAVPVFCDGKVWRVGG